MTSPSEMFLKHAANVVAERRAQYWECQRFHDSTRSTLVGDPRPCRHPSTGHPF